MRCRPFQRQGSQDIGANVSTVLILNYLLADVLPSPSCLHILVTENAIYTISASRWSFPFVHPYQGSHIRQINYGEEERKGCCWQLHGLELCQSSETRKKQREYSVIFSNCLPLTLFNFPWTLGKHNASFPIINIHAEQVLSFYAQIFIESEFYICFS